MTHIVITGLGAVTPIGNDVESFWTSPSAGVSGAGPLTAFDPPISRCASPVRSRGSTRPAS